MCILDLICSCTRLFLTTCMCCCGYMLFQVALDALRSQNVRVGMHVLNLMDADSIQLFASNMQKVFGKVDILINNAGQK